MKTKMPVRILAFLLMLVGLTQSVTFAASNQISLRNVDIGDGIQLHYVSLGQGTPLIFVHGSLSDYDYWAGIATPFAQSYHVIAYSRRYNYPNHNPERAGYSAIVDADDLAAFMRTLHIRRASIVGHSYGALTALFFAAKYPQMVSALVLAEPPAVSLLEDLPGREASSGKAMYRDIYQRMVRPMQRDFASGKREAGVRDFIDYVFGEPNAWATMSSGDKAATMRDAHEWDVMMTQGTLFPAITPAQVHSIQAPTLLIGGTKTYPFLKPILIELHNVLPHNKLLWVAGAGHQMLYQQTASCDAAIASFLKHGGEVSTLHVGHP